MLKPKYKSMNESVSDFNRMLEGMNKVQPLDRYAVDQEVRARQEEDRLRRELRHVESVIAGSGHFFTEREKAEWYNKRAQIAEMLGEDPEPIAESVACAPPRAGNPISRFRVLAGLEEQVMMPRDPGLSGTTRHNYDSMMESFDDEDEIEEGGMDPVRKDMSVTARMRASGKSISMGAPTEREQKARRMAKKHGQDAASAHKKADIRQTINPKKKGIALRAIDDLRSMSKGERDAYRQSLRKKKKSKLP